MNLFIFILSVLFHSRKTEERILFEEESFNEITLKINGPINKFGFFQNDPYGYCFRGNAPNKIIVNNQNYINNITNISEYKLSLNFVTLKWNKTISNFSYMFSSCENILEVDLTLMNLSFANNFEYMFADCKSLTSVKLFDLNLRKKNIDTNLNFMFSNCSSLTLVSINNSQNVENMGNLIMCYMFNACISLSSINITNIHLSSFLSYLNMEYMFNDCTSLHTVDIYNISVAGYLYIDYMFKGCTALFSVYFSFSSDIILTLSNTIYMDYFFSGCKNLRYINFTGFPNNNIIISKSIFDDIFDNIAYCIDMKNPLYHLLSEKKCSIFDCTYNWFEKQRKIIYKNNTCINNCTEYSLLDYKNICYDSCKNTTYKDGAICKDCYPSCETCNQPGTENNHNCITCKKGYTLIHNKTNTTLNCYKNNYYNREIYNMYVNECYIGYNIFYNLFFCLNHCTNNYIYFCDINKQYDLKNYSYSCEYNYIENILCFFNDENSYNKEKLLNHILYILRKKLLIDNLIPYAKQPFFMEASDFRFIITSNKDEQYKNDIKNITKLIKCENEIKDKYQIPKNSSLYLLITIKILKGVSFIEREYEIYYFFKGIKIKETCKFKEEILNKGNNCTFILTTNNECTEQCSIQDVLNKRCIINNNDKINKTDINEFHDNILNVFIEEIESGLYNLSSLDNGEDIIIKNEKLKISFTTSDKQEKYIKNATEMTIHLGDCENKLREKYNISGNLFLLKINDNEEGYKIPKINYDVYAQFNSNKLERLDLSICEGDKITLQIPLLLNFTNDDLDKYDINSKYYQEYCINYQDENGADITLSDRRDEYLSKSKNICDIDCYLERYDNNSQKSICKCQIQSSEIIGRSPNLCENDCTSEYDSNLKKYICKCLTRIEKIKKETKKVIKLFKDYKKNSNIYILKCNHLLLNKDNLNKNIGFLIIFPLSIIYVLSIIIVFCHDFKSIINNIDNIINTRKEIKEKKKKTKLDEIKEMDDVQKNNKNKDSKKKSSKISHNKNNNNPPIKKSKNKKNKNSIISNKRFHLGKKNIIKNQKISSTTSTNNSRKAINPENLLINLEKKYTIMEYSPTELNELPYEKAKELDERPFCKYYLHLLISNNIWLFTFYKTNDYNSRFMKIDLFFYTFIVHFGVNALFFTDLVIQKIKENGNELGFLYRLPNIIYSFIISTVLKKILKILSLSEKNILNLKRKEIKDLDEESKSIKKLVFIKCLLFFIISLVILIFFLFYLSCFCAVYRNTQFYIIKDSLVSYGTDFITPFFISLIPGLFRKCALKEKNRKCLYCLSKLFQMI